MRSLADSLESGSGEAAIQPVYQWAMSVDDIIMHMQARCLIGKGLFCL